MELEVLKKKISSFKTKGGYLKNISDDLLMEILDSWECWEGSSRSFYIAIGTDYRKMASLMGKAKRLRQEGCMASEFKEVSLESPSITTSDRDYSIELVWDNGKIIRFDGVDLVIDFLRKAA